MFWVLVRPIRVGVGRVEQFQVAVDGLPQLIFGIPAQTAVLSAPVVVPVGGVNLAQVAERRVQLTDELVMASGG